MALSRGGFVPRAMRSSTSPTSSESSTPKMPLIIIASNTPAPPSTSGWSTPRDQLTTATAMSASITPTTPQKKAPRRDRPNT